MQRTTLYGDIGNVDDLMEDKVGFVSVPGITIKSKTGDLVLQDFEISDLCQLSGTTASRLLSEMIPQAPTIPQLRHANYFLDHEIGNLRFPITFPLQRPLPLRALFA